MNPGIKALFKSGNPELARAANEMFGSTNETTGELVINPGTVLPNGAVVIAASCRYAHEWVILALRPGFHAGDNYITWKTKRPGNGECHWGHYFDKLEEAVADWKTR